MLTDVLDEANGKIAFLESVIAAKDAEIARLTAEIQGGHTRIDECSHRPASGLSLYDRVSWTIERLVRDRDEQASLVLAEEAAHEVTRTQIAESEHRRVASANRVRGLVMDAEAALAAERQKVAALREEMAQAVDSATNDLIAGEPTPHPAVIRSSTAARRSPIKTAFDAIDALRKMTWQPIATAPKDGTVILGFNGRMTAIEWSGDAWNLAETHDYPEDTRWEYPPPTHWMPLPDPPTVDATPVSEGM